MAPNICVRSFRLLLRRPDIASQMNRNWRLVPALLTENSTSWTTNTRRYYVTDDLCPEDEKPIKGQNKSLNDTATLNPEKSTTAHTTPTTTTTAAAAAVAATTATATAAAAAARFERNKRLAANAHAQPPETSPPTSEPPALTAIEHAKAPDYSQMRIMQLRAHLRTHGLSTVGKREALIRRLLIYQQLQQGKENENRIAEEVSEQLSNDIKESIQATEKEQKEANKAADKSSKLLTTEDPNNEVTEETIKLTESVSDTTMKRLTDEDNHTLRASADSNTLKAFEDVHGFAATSKENNKHDKATGGQHNDNTDDGGSSGSKAGSGNGNGNDDPPEQMPASQNQSVCHDEVRRGDAYVEYIQGLPHLTVPLPSRSEKCRFALKPISQHVGDLLEMLKMEDRGIDRATVVNKAGVRIASTCNIESLMDEPFVLQVNNLKYEVVPPKRERIDSEDINKLGDVRSLVAQLYEALHVGEYHIKKEKELTSKLENLKFEISPLEMRKEELSKQAERKTLLATWFGLSLMSVQFGILARLTWWEYSWDIMEPVTYFVTYGTTLAMYAYYCVTKTEYNFPQVRNRLFLNTIHKRAKKKNFDVDRYNALKRQIAEIEYDLRRLHDPLNLQLPPHIDRAQTGPPAASNPSTITETKKCEKKEKSTGFRLPFLDSKK